MIKEVNLRSEHLRDFQAFMLFYSPKARGWQMFNTLGVFGEAMIAGFLVDHFAGTQVFTLIGAVFGVLWLIFYPIFLRSRRRAALATSVQEGAQKMMKFELGQDWLAFYEQSGQTQAKFDFDAVSEIYELKNIFVIFLHGKIHLVIPKEQGISEMISLIAKGAKKHILKYENLDFASVMR